MNNEAQDDKYIVTKIRQNEVQDIFSVYNRYTGETDYEYFNRTSEMNAQDVLDQLR